MEKGSSEVCSQVVNSTNTLKRSRLFFSTYKEKNLFTGKSKISLKNLQFCSCNPIIAAKISVASSHAQARDYALYCTALILQELVMQIMPCLGQTNCHTHLFLSRAGKARWKDWYMSHTLNQQHNLEQKLSLQSPDSSWLSLLEGPVSVSIPIKTTHTC